jgi:hypothetical protein
MNQFDAVTIHCLSDIIFTIITSSVMQYPVEISTIVIALQYHIRPAKIIGTKAFILVGESWDLGRLLLLPSSLLSDD